MTEEQEQAYRGRVVVLVNEAFRQARGLFGNVFPDPQPFVDAHVRLVNEMLSRPPEVSP